MRPGPASFCSRTTTSALPDFADRVTVGLSGRLLSLFASDERDVSGRFLLHHLWFLPGLRTFLRIAAPVLPAEPSYPSIAAKYPVANWFEREVMDFFGLVPEGHPNPTRVALHDDWPDGAWALRKDFPYDAAVPRVPGDFHPFRPVTGEGVFQVPVGPVHAGIIEPGHFRFGVAGEPVLYLQLRLFYVHKGTEKRFERLPWRHGLFLAQSISGDTAVGHSLAYAHAIERLAEITVPARARALRVVLLELERLYNHTADIGALATDVAFTVPASRAQALREGLVRLHDQLFGTRLLRGTIALGRSDARLAAAESCDALRAHLHGIREAVRRADPTCWWTPARLPIASMAPAFSVSRPREIWGLSGWPLVHPASMATCAETIRTMPTRDFISRCPSKTAEMPGHGSWCVRGRSSSRWSFCTRSLPRCPTHRSWRPCQTACRPAQGPLGG